MDAFFPEFIEEIFTCSCGWTGIQSDLDLSEFKMVRCPECRNDDVRVLNNELMPDSSFCI